MAFGDTFKKLIGLEEMDEEISEEEVKKEMESMRGASQIADNKVSPFTPKAQPQMPVENRVSINATNAFKLVVIEPKSFDECPKLVDSLKGRRPVIINLEKVETESAKKIFDFLSGATYALDGNVQKIANNIFIFAPASVDIAANQEERGFTFSGKGKNPWG